MIAAPPPKDPEISGVGPAVSVGGKSVIRNVSQLSPDFHRPLQTLLPQTAARTTANLQPPSCSTLIMRRFEFQSLGGKATFTTTFSHLALGRVLRDPGVPSGS